MNMFCSTIVPTIGRATLSRAVDSVLTQAFDSEDFEVIVVNDSGRPLPEAEWQRSSQVRILDTNRRERCVARNTGAAVARGRYLHFLDDDDWMLPGAFHSLWELSLTTDAAWLYGSSQLVDREGRPLLQLRHDVRGNCFVQVMAGEWVPLQSSLIRADAFFAIGGFAPLVTGREDIDLCRRIALRGDLVGTEAVVACIGMGAEGSSTDHDRASRYARRAREPILDEPGAFRRLRTSADSGVWWGRVARVYLTSAIWNLQHRKGFTAASRAAIGLAACALASRHLLTSDFWRAVARPYFSETFSRGAAEAARVAQTESNLRGATWN